MSDRCEKFVTMPTGSGYDDRCAVCGVPCEEHPSDKARCSHPSEDEKPIRFCHLHFGHYGPHEWAAPLSPIALDPCPLDFEAAFIAEGGYKGSRFEQNLQEQARALVARVAQEEREKYEGRIKEVEEESGRRWGLVLRLQGERDDLRKLLRRVEAVVWFAVKFFNGGRIEIGRRQLEEFEPSNATLETFNAPEDGRFIITATGGTP